MSPTATSRRYLVMLAVLALIWGSSFMFIKVAVRELDPATLIFGRLALATLTLAVVVAASAGFRPMLGESKAARRPWPIQGRCASRRSSAN